MSGAFAMEHEEEEEDGVGIRKTTDRERGREGLSPVLLPRGQTNEGPPGVPRGIKEEGNVQQSREKRLVRGCEIFRPGPA